MRPTSMPRPPPLTAVIRSQKSGMRRALLPETMIGKSALGVCDWEAGGCDHRYTRKSIDCLL